MQAAGMLRGTIRGLRVLFIGTLILAYIGENAHALPLQILPNIPGYIPVYIRQGDQPLDEINPALAEAFHEKQILENTPPEQLDSSSNDRRDSLENHSSFDGDRSSDDPRRKDTLYLIGVRQSNGEVTKNDLAPKIALPFEVLQREAIQADSPESEKSGWIDQHDERRNEGLPIGLSKEAVIKKIGLPADVKELERLADKVEKEETRSNNLYDTLISHDRDVSTSRHPDSAALIYGDSKQEKNTEKIKETTVEQRRAQSNEDPKEFLSESRMSERLLRPAKDPKESRPDDRSMEFMLQEE